jgi:glycosyltransferase involved in cell wall biosynthesis
VRVVFFTRYGALGASSRYRFYQYEKSLKARDFDCRFYPLFSDRILVSRYKSNAKSVTQNATAVFTRCLHFLRLRNVDLVVLEGEFLPYFPPFFEYMLKFLGIPYSVDFDDAIFHYYDKSPRWLVRRLLGRKIASVVGQAAFIVAGNQYLADYAIAANAKRIEVVPTVVDLEKYPQPDFRLRDSLSFQIGWIGSPGSSRYLQSIKVPLSDLVFSHQCKLKLIGAGCDHGLHHLYPESKEWSDLTEVSEINTFDVGIMPLPSDDWAKGKCGFKLIQYMACGKPVIASPVGVNTEIINHGVNGFLAATEEEWMVAVKTLRDKPELAVKMGMAGRRMVQEKYSLQVTSPRIAEIFESVSRTR